MLKVLTRYSNTIRKVDTFILELSFALNLKPWEILYISITDAVKRRSILHEICSNVSTLRKYSYAEPNRFSAETGKSKTPQSYYLLFKKTVLNIIRETIKLV